MHEALVPVGDFERDLAQSIADDGWRLKRARAIEASTFALGAHEHAASNTGHSEVDSAFAQARTWEQAAHNLHLLTVYEQRIRRAMDENMAQLKTLQTERKEAAPTRRWSRLNSCIDMLKPKANPTSRRHFSRPPWR